MEISKNKNKYVRKVGTRGYKLDKPFPIDLRNRTGKRYEKKCHANLYNNNIHICRSVTVQDTK